MRDDLDLAMLIVQRCRLEGAEDVERGKSIADCPYSDELERASWLDGWRKRKAAP